MYVRQILRKFKIRCKVTPRTVQVWLMVTIVISHIVLSTAEKVLAIKHVRHFEPVYYDNEALHHQHHVNKRSTNARIGLVFEAYDIHFKVRLKRDASPLHPNVVIETSYDQVPYDITRVYSGDIEGYPSRVNGIITMTGHFEGRITVGNETYFLERSHYHFSEPHAFHSVIYRRSDVTFNPDGSLCGVDKLYESQRYFNTGVVETDKDSSEQNENWKLRYSKGSSVHKNDLGNHRNRRAVDPAKVTCELYMQADHLFFERYYSDVDTVIEKLTQHVQALNNIFPALDFDQNGSPDNINFIIKKIKVHTNSSASGYKYSGNLGVETFLDLHSGDNYDAYCLSYLFTYRDFDGGVLGLAWVGDTSLSGGVCEINKEYQGTSKSLNTGIVTIVNYNHDVPSAVSHVTFAHEVGHNFGSQHDPVYSSVCTPGGDAGNYIMYAYATAGDQANNNDFSSCSLHSIGPVLEAKARGTDGCFVGNVDGICGNRVVEGSEECDCGWDTECIEGCCTPQSDSPGPETPCTLKSSAVCSPSEGACCTSSCQFRLAAENHSCRPATSCQDEAFCDGANYNANCPPSVAKPNTTSCGDSQDFLVCYKGECSGSICMAHGRVSCHCSASSSGDWTDAKLCQVCCKDDNGDCKSSFELADIPDADVVAGTPCNNFQGYCDVFKKCRKVDPAGPLSNLKKLFLDGELVNAVKEFLTTHWYVGLAAGLGFVIIIGLVVKFCRKTYKPKPVDCPSPTSPRPPGRNQVSPERF